MGKKILVLLHTSNLNNGATRSIVDVLVGLKRNSHIEPIVLYPDKRGSAIDYLEKKTIKCKKIIYGRWDYPINLHGFKKVLFFSKSLLKQAIGFFNLFKIKRIIQKEKIDVIYTNTSVIYEGALINKFYKIPHIWHVREFGIKDHNIKYMWNKFEKYLNNYSTKIIFISHSLYDYFRNSINDKNKAYVIYNDISKDFVNPRDAFNYKDKLKVCIIGTIQKTKGQFEFIRAAEVLKNTGIPCEFHIAGDVNNQYAKNLINYIHKNKLEGYVIFDGFIKNVNKYRSKMDIGVIASSNEAFGRVTIEGMLSQLVMIGANSCGTSELINGKNGLLYKLGDYNELAKIIKKLHTNRDLIEKTAKNGYNFALSFTNGNASAKINEIIIGI